MSLLKLFCNVDDFWQAFQPHWRRVTLARKGGRRVRATMSPSEIMTILIHFHQSHYRNFKAYYTEYTLVHLRPEFPGGYNRFVEFYRDHSLPATAPRNCTGLAFVDATASQVCHNKRIPRHQVFAGDRRPGQDNGLVLMASNSSQ